MCYDRNDAYDDFYLDGSNYGIDDLDHARVQFFGGSLDGNVTNVGMESIPEEITARVGCWAGGDTEVERYVLTSASPDDVEYEAYYRYEHTCH